MSVLSAAGCIASVRPEQVTLDVAMPLVRFPTMAALDSIRQRKQKTGAIGQMADVKSKRWTLTQWRVLFAMAIGVTVLMIPTLEGEGIAFFVALYVTIFILMAKPQ
jgi:hypothetical protein